MGVLRYTAGVVAIAAMGLSGCLSDILLTTRGSTTTSQALQAAQDTAETHSNCTAVAPFYWEIGDQSGLLIGGTVGGSSPNAQSVLTIASASKWMFGAYVLEKLSGSPDAAAIKALTMKTGYTSFDTTCVGTATVNDCFNAGSNESYTASDDGDYFYGGGHFQKYAVDTGMGAFTNAALANDYKNYLGNDLSLSFVIPQPAGGVSTSPATYALFLRKILNQTLEISSKLGASPVCTLPATCPSSNFSPVPESWHYSYGHWVEDDPTHGDGTFSSPGKFGFYPWIDSSKTYYGILGRYDTSAGAYWDSVLCGRLIRKAFLTGEVQ